MERTTSEWESRAGRLPYRTFETTSGFKIQKIDSKSTSMAYQSDEINGLHSDEAANTSNNACAPSKPPAIEMATPPIPIKMSPSVSRSRSRLRVSNADDMEATEKTPEAAKMEKKARRRKKKKAQKNAVEPAMNIVRGFTPTPVPSGDDDSDYFSAMAFKRKDLSVNTSLSSSPYLRPVSRAGSVTGGISALRQQLDALDLEPVPGNPGMIRNKSKARSTETNSPTSGSAARSDADNEEMTSYEVPLEHDFISREAVEESNEFSAPAINPEDVHRKMTASDFQPITCLGKGSFGTVHLVKQVATGRLYAQKQFRKASLTVHKTLIEQTKTERAILESINRHPFVVKLYYAFQDQEKLYLILEYAQGGELFTHLAAERMFPEDTASFYSEITHRPAKNLAAFEIYANTVISG